MWCFVQPKLTSGQMPWCGTLRASDQSKGREQNLLEVFIRFGVHKLMHVSLFEVYTS